MAAQKRDIEASKVGILKAREESDKKRGKGMVDEENGKGRQHIWGHLRQRRVWSMEARETREAGRDRPSALVWQLLCARRSIYPKYWLYLPPLSILSPKSQPPLQTGRSV